MQVSESAILSFFILHSSWTTAKSNCVPVFSVHKSLICRRFAPSVAVEYIGCALGSPLILQCGLERGMACQFLSYNQSVKALIPRQKENTPWVKHYPFSKPRSTTLCRSNPVRNT